MDQQQQARRRKRVLRAAGIVAALAFSITVFGGYLFGWKWTGLPKQTFWDWLDILLVPLVLAIGGYLFTRSENRATQAAAERRAQDEALQAYLDQMSDMLIPPSKDLPSLYKARPGDSLSSVARGRTLTVLTRLDGDRKARVVQFLYESGLIYKHRSILDLSRANLRRANLREANLQEANLRRANLHWANLYSADLRGANLSQAEPIGAILKNANLSHALLDQALLVHANLSHAILDQADLSHANLNGTDLTGAALYGADLREVTLRRASLRGARGLTEEELAAAVPGVTPVEFALEGATMPNGQQYEEWLKAEEGRGEAG